MTRKEDFSIFNNCLPSIVKYLMKWNTRFIADLYKDAHPEELHHNNRHYVFTQSIETYTFEE